MACNAGQRNNRSKRCVFTGSAALGLGNADADAALGFSGVGSCSDRMQRKNPQSVSPDMAGVKAFALGLSMKDVAFGFSRFAVIAAVAGGLARTFAGVIGLRVTPGVALAVACGIREALDEVLRDPACLMARALEEDASREVFSRTCLPPWLGWARGR